MGLIQLLISKIKKKELLKIYMAEPISIITLTIVGGLALIKIGKLIIKFRNKKIISNCCVRADIVDLHDSTHTTEIHSVDTPTD